jgi:hypothetical protein
MYSQIYRKTAEGKQEKLGSTTQTWLAYKFSPWRSDTFCTG